MIVGQFPVPDLREPGNVLDIDLEAALSGEGDGTLHRLSPSWPPGAAPGRAATSLSLDPCSMNVFNLSALKKPPTLPKR